jgi:hypothetical protein
MINLHAIVSPLIAALHPNEEISFYLASGQVTDRAGTKALFEPPLTVRAQIQSLTAQDLQNDAGVPKSEIGYKAYLFSAADSRGKPASIIRALGRGGDVFQRADGTWWKTTALPEDFSASGWVCVNITEQIIEPDFTACPWWPLPVEGA